MVGTEDDMHEIIVIGHYFRMLSWGLNVQKSVASWAYGVAGC